MSVPTLEELVETALVKLYERSTTPWGASAYWDEWARKNPREAMRRALLAVLDRLKPVVAETYVQGVLGCPSEGYRPGTANDIEVDAKAYATRIIDQIKGA